jgi:hypothetical protein
MYLFLRRWTGFGSSLSEDGLQQRLIPRSLHTARPALIGTTTTTTTTTADAVATTTSDQCLLVDLGKPAEVVL